MILGALASYYERLAEDRERRHVPPIGYSYENISYVLILNLDGSPVRLEPWQDTSNRKPRPKREVVPLTERTSGVKAKFLWDNSSYIFGRSSKSKRCEREHNNFKQLHERLLEGTDDPGLKALLCYLRCWRPECLDTLPGAESILGEENANIIFRLDSDIPFLHAQEAAKEIWSRNFGKDNVSPGVCLVSGDHTLIANIHPVIKGVRDAQTRGACIVSFNANAFTSFGKEGGANAPVEANRVYAYTLALNYLLAEARQRAQIADATTVFWAEADLRKLQASSRLSLVARSRTIHALPRRTRMQYHCSMRSRKEGRLIKSTRRWRTTKVASTCLGSLLMLPASQSVFGRVIPSPSSQTTCGSTIWTSGSAPCHGRRRRQYGGFCYRRHRRGNPRTCRQPLLGR